MRALLLLLAAVASATLVAALACGVKAPPRPTRPPPVKAEPAAPVQPLPETEVAPDTAVVEGAEQGDPDAGTPSSDGGA